VIWVWIPKSTVHGIHSKGLGAYGGAEGIRDEGLLESALAGPGNLASYEKPNVFELAAAYGSGTVRNRPFVDGNKRTAFLTASLFLELNGQSLNAEEAEATAIMLAFAAGEATEQEFSLWLKANSEAP